MADCLKKQGAEKRTRPGGRTERVRKAVADAVIELVTREGIEFEILSVARLSGVGRATIFRRWPDRASLIREALAEHNSNFEVTMTGDWKVDLRRVAADLQAFFSRPAELAFNRALFFAKSGELQEEMLRYWDPIMNSITMSLEEARRLGQIEKATNVQIVVHSLLSSLLMGSLIDGAYIESAALVDQLCRGVRERASRSSTSARARQGQSDRGVKQSGES